MEFVKSTTMVGPFLTFVDHKAKACCLDNISIISFKGETKIRKTLSDYLKNSKKSFVVLVNFLHQNDRPR